MEQTNSERIAAMVDQATEQAIRRRSRRVRLIRQIEGLLLEQHTKVQQARVHNNNNKTDNKLQQEISRLETTKQKLLAETKQYGWQIGVRDVGLPCWNQLTEANKWKKGNVLALLDSRRHARMSRDWDENASFATVHKAFVKNCVHETIRNDRDIMLAHLQHGGFVKICNNEYLNGYIRLSFQLPEQFSSDKEIVLAVLAKDPEMIDFGVLSQELLDDEDVLFNFFRSPGYRDSETSLPKFSARLRGNKRVMLEVAKDTMKVFDLLEGELLNDPQFALELADIVAKSLAWFNASMPETHGWFNFPKSSLGLFSDNVRSNEQVVAAFVTNNWKSIIDAPEPIKKKLGADREFMLKTLKKRFYWNPHWGRHPEPYLYNVLSDECKLDRELIAMAVKNGHLPMNLFPVWLSNDRDFWLDYIRSDPCFYSKLPSKFYNDLVFVKSKGDFMKKSIVDKIFERSPFLKSDRDVWFKIIDSSAGHSRGDIPRELSTIYEEHAPQHIRHDREFMKRALENEFQNNAFEILPVPFQQDREMVSILLESDPFAIWKVPHDGQRRCPDLICKAMLKTVEVENKNWPLFVNDSIDCIAPELWSDQKVWKAYFDSFDSDDWGYTIVDHCTDSMKNDEQWGLFFAENIIDYDFESATSEALRGNKDFMLKAVQKTGCHLLTASADLVRDVEVAVAAFGCRRDGQALVETFCGESEWSIFDDGNFDEELGELSFLRRVLSHAVQELQVYDGFFAGILCGMSNFAGPTCGFSILARDTETSLALKRTIASFVGIPPKEKISSLCRAIRNLNVAAVDEKMWDANS